MDYKPSYKCCNSKSLDKCLKCGKCGRRFRKGILIDNNGDEFYLHMKKAKEREMLEND